MYGLVNSSIRSLVCNRYGDDKWQLVLRKAGLPDEPYFNMLQYSDTITSKLFEYSAQVIGVTNASFMEEVGYYWTNFTMNAGYGCIMALAGKTFDEFVKNLDELHARVALIYPELSPPSFSYDPIDDCSFRLSYFSKRNGLQPFVVGLLKGLGAKFSRTVDVTLLQKRTSPKTSDIFFVVHKAYPTPANQTAV